MMVEDHPIEYGNVRRRDPGRLRRGDRHALGSRHVDTASGRRGCGAEEGRPEVHARRLQAQRILGAGANRRSVSGAAAATAAGCSSSIRDEWAGEVDIVEFAPQERQERAATSKISWRLTGRMCGSPIARPRAAKRARCWPRLSSAQRRSSRAPRCLPKTKTTRSSRLTTRGPTKKTTPKKSRAVTPPTTGGAKPRAKRT